MVGWVRKAANLLNWWVHGVWLVADALAWAASGCIFDLEVGGNCPIVSVSSLCPVGPVENLERVALPRGSYRPLVASQNHSRGLL